MDGPKLLPVECGACGWLGKRKPGNLVTCPKCGACAGFQPLPAPPEKRKPARPETAAEVVTTSWHVGVSRGSVIGELKKVDDYEQDREFVIVPTVGAAAITCTFPDAMRTEMGKYLFSVVKVTGLLHYGASSPFPFKVETFEDGIELFPKQKPRRTLSEMRGVFSGRNLTEVNWGNLLDG